MKSLRERVLEVLKTESRAESTVPTFRDSERTSSHQETEKQHPERQEGKRRWCHRPQEKTGLPGEGVVNFNIKLVIYQADCK